MVAVCDAPAPSPTSKRAAKETVSTPKTRLEREFEPQAVHDLKAQLPYDISVAGPNLAAQAIRAGLVDEYQLLFVIAREPDGGSDQI